MDFYTAEQTYAILNQIGVQIVSETDVVWTCLCPFHGNTDTPAFAVNKDNGTFICFNGACGAHGNMVSLVSQLQGNGLFAAHRLIERAKSQSPADVSVTLQKILTQEPLPEFSQDVLDAMYANFWRSQKAQEYMYGRGFTEETLKHYAIGYSTKKDMIGVPMHDWNGNPVGLVGRTISSKRFQNSDNLPKKETLFNLHRAKRTPKAIICEASFDAMMVWQASGYEAMATLGSSFSDHHAEQLNKYFTHVVIFTDDDTAKPTVIEKCARCRKAGEPSCIGHNTGQELGMSIAEKCRGLVVTWAHLDSLLRYDGLKDAGDMTAEQINYALRNDISHAEMLQSV